MLDASLRLTFRHFATLFLLVATVTVPLHVGVAFAYRDVVAVSELHPAIDEFPPKRRVRGVGPPELGAARRAVTVLTIVEVALLPVAVGATRRVLSAHAKGRLEGVLDGWAHGVATLTRRPNLAAGRAGPLEVGAGLALGVVAGYALYRMGLPFVDATPPAVRFGPAGLLDGAARAFGGPFVLVPLALFGGRAKDVISTRPT
jgi:hypothetical protein